MEDLKFFCSLVEIYHQHHHQGGMLTQAMIPLHAVQSILQAPRFSSSIPESHASVPTKSCAGQPQLFFPCFGLQRMSCAAASSLCQ